MSDIHHSGKSDASRDLSNQNWEMRLIQTLLLLFSIGELFLMVDLISLLTYFFFAIIVIVQLHTMNRVKNTLP